MGTEYLLKCILSLIFNSFWKYIQSVRDGWTNTCELLYNHSLNVWYRCSVTSFRIRFSILIYVARCLFIMFTSGPRMSCMPQFGHQALKWYFCFAGQQVLHVHRTAEEARRSEQTSEHCEPSPVTEPNVPHGQGPGRRQTTQVQLRLHSKAWRFSTGSKFKASCGTQGFLRSLQTRLIFQVIL